MKTVMIYNNSFNWFSPFFDFQFAIEPECSSIFFDEKRSQDTASYYVEYFLPDMKKKNISLKLGTNQLIIKAFNKKKSSRFGERSQMESVSVKSILLTDDMETDKIKAEYKNGVLKIEIPKRTGINSKIVVDGKSTEAIEDATIISDSKNSFFSKLKGKINEIVAKIT